MISDEAVTTEGWCNRWDAAIDMAARAQLRVEDLEQELADMKEQRDDAILETANTVNDIIGVRYQLKESLKQRDRLVDALKIIDERVVNRSDCETDLKFCGEVAFAALAAVKDSSKF
jgi:hypothetical protein